MSYFLPELLLLQVKPQFRGKSNELQGFDRWEPRREHLNRPLEPISPSVRENQLHFLSVIHVMEVLLRAF